MTRDELFADLAIIIEPFTMIPCIRRIAAALDAGDLQSVWYEVTQAMSEPHIQRNGDGPLYTRLVRWEAAANPKAVKPYRRAAA